MTRFARPVPMFGLLTLATVFACQSGPAPVPDEAPAAPVVEAAPAERAEADLLSNPRQLIFDGVRSGEGYFSADGRALIFQSEREPQNPFYQIYVLDLETGDTRRVSPGWGKTTCAWIHPDGAHALFASTHEEPEARAEMQAELDFRASGQTRRYSWDYDEAYDIFQVTMGGDDYKNLTHTKGYDAEGSWSPDGSSIVFASNRLAYSAPLSAEDKAGFERDAAYMMDIYRMNADGTDVRRLTETPGYDGGPFFSPDGKLITWRRFSPDGHTAEIWVMNAGGSGQRPLTHLNAMSWAPYFHPSGDYLIFATNVHGFQNFELYLVDTAGQKEPVRVTFTEGWDGLPVFSPDGSKLAWSSGRTADKKAQIFMADWNDATARRLLALSPARDQPRYTHLAPSVSAEAGATAITADDARRWVEALTTEQMDGRRTGTPGEAAATAWVASAFEKAGLLPAGPDGFFQPFSFTAGVKLNGPNVLSIQVEGAEPVEPVLDTDWRPLAFSKPGSVGFAEAVFAGYGIVAPAQEGQEAYDAYGDLDVKGKWVVVLRYMPEDIEPAKRQQLGRYASLRFKAMEARDRGAVGLIVVAGPAAEVREELVPLRFDAAVAGTSITAVSVVDALAAPWFTAAGHPLAEAQAALDKGAIVPGFPLSGVKLGGHLSLEAEQAVGRNVLGRLQVGASPSAEVIVIGAHVDHLGRGESGDSMARPEERGMIHHGADDNASGIAGLVEIAAWLAEEQRTGALKGARRDIVFAAWSGEELGLLGASWYVDHAQQGAPSLYPGIAAYLNMDMIGRLREQLTLQGIGSSPFWRGEIERRNVPVGLNLTLSDDTFLPTDATAFYLKGVPILAAFTGVHSEYHTPRDLASTLNYQGLADTARLMGNITRGLTLAEAPPEYVRRAPKAQGENRRTGRAYLGTIPDYAQGEITGVKLSGVSAGGPAEKAGVVGGDILVELAGKPLENIYDYMKVLDSLKIGQEVDLVVLRDGKRVPLKVTPLSRD